MTFISMSEARKRNKQKSTRFVKGYFEGYNNPKQGLADMDRLLKSGKMDTLSQKTKEYVEGRSLGIQDRLREGN